jgi:DNA helicase-2/ATP-dependent DNA helicase PcrA
MDEGGNASLEEERRLAYVAITRARRRCIILHAANRRIYGQWTSSIPSRFVAELPAAHTEEETTMTGGASLWRANWSERSDPFADVSRGSGRGPGWQRAAAERGYVSFADRVKESTDAFRSKASPAHVERSRNTSCPREVQVSAVSLGNPGRSDVSVGQRVFHSKFGYGTVAEIEGNKLEIDFEHSGRKRVLDSFVSVA